MERISSGFSFTTTLTLAMLLDERFVRYVPSDYHMRVGSSKVQLQRDSLRTLQILVQAILYYNPMKIFLAVCLACVLSGAVVGMLLALSSLATGLLFFGLSLLTAAVVGGLGLIAEIIRLRTTGRGNGT